MSLSRQLIFPFVFLVVEYFMQWLFKYLVSKALHLDGESREVTREQHAKGNASARGGKRKGELNGELAHRPEGMEFCS